MQLSALGVAQEEVGVGCQGEVGDRFNDAPVHRVQVERGKQRPADDVDIARLAEGLPLSDLPSWCSEILWRAPLLGEFVGTSSLAKHPSDRCLDSLGASRLDETVSHPLAHRLLDGFGGSVGGDHEHWDVGQPGLDGPVSVEAGVMEEWRGDHDQVGVLPQPHVQALVGVSGDESLVPAGPKSLVEGELRDSFPMFEE